MGEVSLTGIIGMAFTTHEPATKGRWPAPINRKALSTTPGRSSAVLCTRRDMGRSYRMDLIPPSFQYTERKGCRARCLARGTGKSACPWG